MDKNYLLDIMISVRERKIDVNEAVGMVCALEGADTSEGRNEKLSCGRNITTCMFYKEGGKCSNLEYCRDQTT